MSNIFYIDCEFDGHNGPLISFGITCSNDPVGWQIAVSPTPEIKDLWVADNVMPKVNWPKETWPGKFFYCKLNFVGYLLLGYIKGQRNAPQDTVIIRADSPVDIGRFCTAISTDIHGKWNSVDFKTMIFEVHDVESYPSPHDEYRHNSLADAMSLKLKLEGEYNEY